MPLISRIAPITAETIAPNEAEAEREGVLLVGEQEDAHRDHADPGGERDPVGAAAHSGFAPRPPP